MTTTTTTEHVAKQNRSLARYLPILQWLPHYDRSWLTADFLAGLTLWGLVVPEAMAYAGVAGLPPQAGLYTLLAALLVYALFGTSRHLVVQATSATAALLASAVVATLVTTNIVTDTLAPVDPQIYQQYAVAFTLVVGVIFLLAGIARLGFITQFLSKPVMSGYITGLALFVAVGQLNERLAVDMEDATRLNVCALAVQVFIGGEYETQSIENMTQLVDFGNQYGIPVLAVTAVGKDMARDARYFRLACGMCAELGAHFVKSYYIPDGFDTVTSSCPVPIVMAGGKKLPELDALTMAYNAVDQGASGVDMGRNIFQSEAPAAMLQAVRAVVHGGETPERAHELFRSLDSRPCRCQTSGITLGDGDVTLGDGYNFIHF